MAIRKLLPDSEVITRIDKNLVDKINKNTLLGVPTTNDVTELKRKKTKKSKAK